MKFWDVSSSTLIATIPGYTSRIEGIAFTNDDRLIATASLDGTVRLWGIPDA